MNEYQRRCIHSFSEVTGKCTDCGLFKKDWLAAQRIPEWVQCKHEFLPGEQRCTNCNKLFEKHKDIMNKPRSNRISFCQFCGGKIPNLYCKFCDRYFGEVKSEQKQMDPLILVFKRTINRCEMHIESIRSKCAHEYKYHSDIKGDNGYGKEYVIRERVICVKCEKLSERSLSGNIGPKTGFE